MLAVAALTFAGVEGLQEVGTWDTISIGVLMLAGLLVGAASIERRGAVVLSLLTSWLALAGLEVGSRLWLPPPPSFPGPAVASLLFKPAAWDAGCSVLHAASVDDDVHVLRRVPPDAEARLRDRAALVVHVGDSMTFGEGVRDEETFPWLLDRRDPAVVHRNYGIWAVGVDFEYLLLQRVLAEHSPAMVVLHLYVGNDVYDIDRPYACCDAGPLLDYGTSGPTARCPKPHWRFPVTFRLSRSPPPYPLRVVANWSFAARHCAAALSRWASALEPGAAFISAEGEANESDWDHFAQILAQLRDDLAGKTQLVVVLLPARRALEAADPNGSASYIAGKRIEKITTALGIRTLDPWNVFVEAVKKDGSRKYFLDENNIHFTPEGNRLLADWLEKELFRR